MTETNTEFGLVSVIMPAYNEEKYIGEAIQSVLNQIYQNWELIIVDDGSKDRTLEIVREYASGDSRIRVYSFSENKGACAALNEAIKRAEGKYIGWLSADDRYNKEMLQSGVAYLTEHKNYGAVFCKSDHINEASELIGKANVPQKFTEIGNSGCVEPYYTMVTRCNAFGACSVLATADAYRKAGFFDEKHPYAGDYHFMMRVAAYADFGFLDEYNVQTRIHPEQVSNEGKNEIDAICAYSDIVFLDDVRKRLYQKAGLPDTRETVLETFRIRRLLYGNLRDYLDGTQEVKTIDEEVKRFLTTFPLVVKADAYCRQISEYISSGEWDAANEMMRNISGGLMDFADKETLGILIGSILDYNMDYESEKDVLENVLKANSSNYEAMYMLGNISEKTGDRLGALERYINSVLYSKGAKGDFEELVQNLKRFLNQMF